LSFAEATHNVDAQQFTFHVNRHSNCK